MIRFAPVPRFTVPPLSSVEPNPARPLVAEGEEARVQDLGHHLGRLDQARTRSVEVMVAVENVDLARAHGLQA